MAEQTWLSRPGRADLAASIAVLPPARDRQYKTDCHSLATLELPGTPPEGAADFIQSRGRTQRRNRLAYNDVRRYRKSTLRDVMGRSDGPPPGPERGVRESCDDFTFLTFESPAKSAAVISVDGRARYHCVLRTAPPTELRVLYAN